MNRSREIVLLAGFAGFALAWFTLRGSRKHGAKRELTEQVHTWEEEGGNVPDVPKVRPRQDSPGFESNSRIS